MKTSEIFRTYKIPKNTNWQPKGMVGWFNVRQLITTGIKTIISNLFGSYADRREIQAAISENEFFDYSDRDEIWFDYVADLGDGFNSTFSVASLLAEDTIEVDGHSIKKADILILGGDEVYPVANKVHYEERFIVPYTIASSNNQKSNDHMYAIPGNHDWYDGLANFLKIFLNDRYIGSWIAKQLRSYFAIKLHEDLWIWGIDIQLDADIDKPQLDYFSFVSKSMKKGDKIILCTANPSWTYNSKEELIAYKVLAFFEQKYIIDRGFKQIITLAGDSHHYSRYSSEQGGISHRITSGGGGAFLHPTHHLSKDVRSREGTLKLEAVFPSFKNSFKLNFLNALFPLLNIEFSVFMGLLYLIISWLLQSVTAYNPVFRQLSQISPKWAHVPAALQKMSGVIIYSPGLLLIIVGIFAGSIAFADKQSGRKVFPYIAGAIHGAMHIVTGLAVIWLLCYLCFHNKIYDMKTVSIFSVGIVILGGLSGASVLGFYLLISNLFGIHDNEAYSAIRWDGYKNFLRFHITADQITIYPVGIKRSRKWKVSKEEIQGNLPETCLIEKPIRIPLKKA